jgi:4Fe-4S iron-sulfur cluster binding domain/DR2241 stabilising domain
MKIFEKLSVALDSGVRQIGEVAIWVSSGEFPYSLSHHLDGDRLDSLTIYHGPMAARDISTWAEDGHYRFTKGELSLKKGWLLHLRNLSELQQALDLFYPAALGLWLAEKEGRIEIQHLREKLGRQTGMYRFAKNISDAGAQRLVRETCGPANCCVKKILWQIDPNTPLEPSEASSYPGVLPDIAENQAIPIFCREACNHFVAECRRVSKEEAGK